MTLQIALAAVIDKPAYKRLSPIQRRFVDYIVQGDTGAEAAHKVKPKSTQPKTIASKWRALPDIQQAIEERQIEAMEDAGISNAQILLGIAALANVNVKRLVWCEGEQLPEGVVVGQAKKLHELDDVTARCIQSIEFTKDGEIKVRFPDRTATKRMLGQYKKLFTETHEINLGEQTLEQLVSASWKDPDVQSGDSE